MEFLASILIGGVVIYMFNKKRQVESEIKEQTMSKTWKDKIFNRDSPCLNTF